MWQLRVEEKVRRPFVHVRAMWELHVQRRGQGGGGGAVCQSAGSVGMRDSANETDQAARCMKSETEVGLCWLFAAGRRFETERLEQFVELLGVWRVWDRALNPGDACLYIRILMRQQVPPAQTPAL